MATTKNTKLHQQLKNIMKIAMSPPLLTFAQQETAEDVAVDALLTLVEGCEAEAIEEYSEFILSRVPDFHKRMDVMTPEEVKVANVACAIVGALMSYPAQSPTKTHPRGQ